MNAKKGCGGCHRKAGLIILISKKRRTVPDVEGSTRTRIWSSIKTSSNKKVNSSSLLLGLTRYLAAGSGNEFTGFFYSIKCYERPEARTSALTEEDFMNRGDKVYISIEFHFARQTFNSGFRISFQS